MLPRRKKPRTVIRCPIERSSHWTIVRDDFVSCRDHNFKLHPRTVSRGWFQKPARHSQVVTDRNIIFPYKLSRPDGHSPLHCCNTGARLHTPLRGVILNEAAQQALQHDRFCHWTKASLPKNGFAFAIENVIPGVGQFQNTTEQISLSSPAIDPKRTTDYHRKNFD